MPRVQTKRSDHGKGVFALKSFETGDIILTVPRTFPTITYAQLLRKRNTDNPLQISPRRYIDWSGVSLYFNHACEPNVGLTSYPNLAYVALRDIKDGEELFWDYSTSIDKDTECDFVCACGAKSCRTTIGGFKHLPLTVRNYYAKLGVVQRYLLQE
jgi:hypothetical protein